MATKGDRPVDFQNENVMKSMSRPSSSCTSCESTTSVELNHVSFDEKHSKSMENRIRKEDQIVRSLPVTSHGSYGAIHDSSSATSNSRRWVEPVSEPPPSNNFDSLGVACSTANVLVGVSLFAMPWGFHQAGVVAAIIALAVIGSVSLDTSFSLLSLQSALHRRTGSIPSFPTLTAATLGTTWGHVTQWSTLLSCLGGCTGYLIFLGETVGQATSTKPSTVLLIAGIPITALSWARAFRDLTVFTLFGGIALVIAAIVMMIDGEAYFNSFNKAAAASAISDGTTIHELNLWDEIVEDDFIHLSTFGKFLGPSVFLFTCHYFVMSMGEETLLSRPVRTIRPQNTSSLSQPQEPSSDNISADEDLDRSPLVTPLSCSFFATYLGIVAVGITGSKYYTEAPFVRTVTGKIASGCEEHVCQNFILNLAPGPARNAVSVVVSVVIVLNYILILAPAREHIERAVLEFFAPVQTTSQYTINPSTELEMTPFADETIARSEATKSSHTSGSYLMVKDLESSITTAADCEWEAATAGWSGTTASEMAIAAGGWGATGVSNSVEENTPLLTSSPRPSFRHPSFDSETNSTSEPTSSLSPTAEAWVRNAIRTSLVALTLGVAIIFPYFGAMVGAVGGLTDALQCFVLPPLILLASGTAAAMYPPSPDLVAAWGESSSVPSKKCHPIVSWLSPAEWGRRLTGKPAYVVPAVARRAVPVSYLLYNALVLATGVGIIFYTASNILSSILA